MDFIPDSPIGHPSSLEGKSRKRTAEESPKSISSQTQDKFQRTDEDHILGKFITHNRFQCLENNFEQSNNESVLTDNEDPSNLNTNVNVLDDSSQNNDGNNRSNQAHLQQHSSQERKPPPIYLASKVKDYSTFAKKLKDSIGNNFHLKYLGSQIKIQFNHTKDFMDFKNFAIAQHYKFHTYSLPEDKSITVVLKGLPNLPSSEIQEELNSLGININYCNLINVDTSNHAIYKINLNAKFTLTHLKKINYLFHSRIYWDKFINNKIILQCYRCQAFGHTSSNCYKSPRCVKCASNHLTKDCTKMPELPATCCNCNGNHPASFSECPSYLKFLEKRNISTRSKFDNKDHQDTLAINKNLQKFNGNYKSNSNLISGKYITSNISQRNFLSSDSSSQFKTYSEALKSSTNLKNPTDSELADFNSLIQELRNLSQTINIKLMLNVIRNLNAKLVTCKDGFEKIQAFIEAADSLA